MPGRGARRLVGSIAEDRSEEGTQTAVATGEPDLGYRGGTLPALDENLSLNTVGGT